MKAANVVPLDDAFALLQGPVKLHDGNSELPEPRRLTVPLRKQYVPMSKDGSIIAYKTSYFGSLQVGRRDRGPFSVVFDTGSGHLVLPNARCSSETCAKHRRYNSTASQDAVDIDRNGAPLLDRHGSRDQLSIQFGTGEVLGEFVRDSICLGPTPEDCFEANMVVANTMTDEPFGLFDFDGILGLGLSPLSFKPQFNLLGQMVSATRTLKPVFSVFLARTDEGQSAISFGGYDESWAASEIRWTPVAMPQLGYWQVEIKSVWIGDEALDDCADGTCRAILDTGSSLLGVPEISSRKMERLLARPVPRENIAYGASIDCRDVPGKEIRFELNSGAIVTLVPEDYTRPKPINMTSPDAKERWDLVCRSLLLPVDLHEPLSPETFLWGEPVLRKYLTLYDWAGPSVGIAAAAAAQPSDDGKSTAIGAPPPGSLVPGVPLRSRASHRTNLAAH